MRDGVVAEVGDDVAAQLHVRVQRYASVGRVHLVVGLHEKVLNFGGFRLALVDRASQKLNLARH